MNVLKRNGRLEEFNYHKLEKQGKFLIKGTDINYDKFLSAINIHMQDGIKSSDIQTIIANACEIQVDTENTDWLLVAGRAVMWDLYGNIYSTTKFNIDQWVEHILWLVSEGRYKQVIKDKLLEYGLKNSDIDYGDLKNVYDSNVDFDKKISSAKAYKYKQVMKRDDGNFIEYPFLIHIANALILSEDKEDFFYFFKKLSKNDLSLATPFLGKLRVPNGNTGSCYIGASINAITGIMRAICDVSYISKEGGGVGWYLGFLSPGGAVHKRVKKTGDKSKYAKILDDIANTIDQAGVRKAGITLADDWWQLDIMSFVEMKSETTGDLRYKTFEIFPQIVIDDFLIDAFFEARDVHLFDHYEFKKKTGIVIQDLLDDELYQAHELVEKMIEEGSLTRFKKINSVDFIVKLFKSWLEIGGMYFVSKEALNHSNYLKDDNTNRLITYCANLCTESYSVTKAPYSWTEKVVGSKRTIIETDGIYHSCNLISINVVNLVEATEEEIYDVCEAAQVALTRSIKLGTNPVRDAENGVNMLQNIGIGTLGVGDYMAYKGVLYDSEEGIKTGMGLQERIAYNCYKASIKYAKEHGSYPAFKKENYTKLFGKTIAELNELSKFTGNNYDWQVILDDIWEHGIANFYLLATAPNTNTGILNGVSSSYLPLFGKLNYETMLDFSVPVAGAFLKEKYWYYKTRYQYNPVSIVKFTEAMQEFVDTGISMEMNLDVPMTDIFDLIESFLKGFKSRKLKSVYYVTAVDTTDNENGSLQQNKLADADIKNKMREKASKKIIDSMSGGIAVCSDCSN